MSENLNPRRKAGVMTGGLSFGNMMLLLGSVTLGRTLSTNPMLFGWKVNKPLPTEDQFPVLLKHDVLDTVLQWYQPLLGEDYEPYRNHCLRVLTLAQYYFQLNNNKEQPSLLSGHQLDVAALAVAYHDIALWTDGTLNYLDPSWAVLEKDVALAKKTATIDNDGVVDNDDNAKDDDNNNDSSSKLNVASSSKAVLLAPFSPDDLETAKQIILQHHKYTYWQQSNSSDDKNKNQREWLVNAVRRADWADATWGLFKAPLPPTYLEALYNTVPDAGFHNMLLFMGNRLSPNSIMGQLEVLKILKW